MIVLSVYWVCKVQAAFQRRKKCANRNPRTFKWPKSSLHFIWAMDWVSDTPPKRPTAPGKASRCRGAHRPNSMPCGRNYLANRAALRFCGHRPYPATNVSAMPARTTLSSGWRFALSVQWHTAFHAGKYRFSPNFLRGRTYTAANCAIPGAAPIGQ